MKLDMDIESVILGGDSARGQLVSILFFSLTKLHYYFGICLIEPAVLGQHLGRSGVDCRKAPHSADLYFVHDIGHRLRASVGSEEGVKRQVPREVPHHPAHAEQAEEVR